MKMLRLIPLAGLMLCSLSSCERYCNIFGPPPGTSKTPCTYGDYASYHLGPSGEKYTHRDEAIVDLSHIQPGPGESYDHFLARVVNTLTIQDYDQRMLAEVLDEKMGQIQFLKKQLEDLEKQNADLRLEMNVLHETVATGAVSSNQPFERYVVKQGDTLQSIANSQYGTHTAWILIFRFNMERLPYGPNRIEIGDELLLPNLEHIAAYYRTS